MSTVRVHYDVVGENSLRPRINSVPAHIYTQNKVSQISL